MNRPTLETLSPVMEQLLAEGKEVHFIPYGTSMLPLIRPKVSKAVLIRPEAPLKKQDIIFYRRTDGSLILHRIIRINGSWYTLCGDNQFVPESGISDEQVIALLKGFWQDGKYYALSGPRYRMYCRLLPLRRLFRHAVYRVKVRLYRIVHTFANNK